VLPTFEVVERLSSCALIIYLSFVKKRVQIYDLAGNLSARGRSVSEQYFAADAVSQTAFCDLVLALE